jgi:hypothetical protein
MTALASEIIGWAKAHLRRAQLRQSAHEGA